MMSVQGEADYLRRSMLAGAREFLVKPFSSDELCASIRQVHAREREKMAGTRPSRQTSALPARRTRGRPRVMALFSPRAASAGRRSPSTSRSPWPRAGPVGRARGRQLPVRRRRRAAEPQPPQQVHRGHRRRAEGGESSRRRRRSSATRPGVRVLLAPPTPEMAELISPSARPARHRPAARDARPRRRRLLADVPRPDPGPPRHVRPVLALLTLEITSIKNIRLFLEVADQLGYGNGQAPAGAQPRGLGLRHPGRGRRALHRPQGRPHGRQRRADRRLRPQSRRAVRLEQRRPR